MSRHDTAHHNSSRHTMSYNLGYFSLIFSLLFFKYLSLLFAPFCSFCSFLNTYCSFFLCIKISFFILFWQIFGFLSKYGKIHTKKHPFIQISHFWTQLKFSKKVNGFWKFHNLRLWKKLKDKPFPTFYLHWPLVYHILF